MTLLCRSLDRLGVLRVAGAQAADLLHAQLSQDFHDWPGGTARLAALCNPQGRMFADLLAVRQAPDEILLLLDQSIAAATLQRLRMFILRLKCTIEDAGATVQRYGLIADGPTDFPADLTPPGQPWEVNSLGAGATLMRLPQAGNGLRGLMLLDSQRPEAGVLRHQLAVLPELSDAAWALSDIRAGIPHVTAATQLAFVPQMLNFERIGGVNFQKGCYPGQEVVARTQYRGTLKRRTYLVRCSTAMQPGQELFHDADPDQPCGLVVNAAPDDTGGWAGLAEIKIALAAQPGLRLGSATGSDIALGALPYTLDVSDSD
jgi:folate-binding protein YgfZ